MKITNNFLLFLFSFLSIYFYGQDENRLALVIGNANYEKGELKNPVNDARLVASTLDSLDFDVILKENLATKRDMTAAIREFGNKRSEYDVAFVYYAGHGIQVDDENFLLPTKEVFKEEFDVMDYGVSVQNIMRYLRSQTNKVNILILDACRDNPFESNWNTTRSLKGGGLAKIPPPTGSLIAFSTDSGQTSPDGDGENSIYTMSLAKNMSIENISIDQVFRNVRSEVLLKTKGTQRPVEATQLVGESFILNKTFSIYESSFNEIVDFSDRKIQNNETDQAIEILNSAANFFKSKNQIREEIFFRKKLVETYAFNKLEDGLPKYFSLNIRNLDYLKITKDDYSKYFQHDKFDIFIKNLLQLLEIDDKKYSKNSEKSYFFSLYAAIYGNYQVIDNNYFSLSDFIVIPYLNLDNFNYESDGLASYWKSKLLNYNFRTNPFAKNKYLINNYEDLNKVIEKEFEFIDNQLTINAEIIKTELNSQLFDFTQSLYTDIKEEIKRMRVDAIAHIQTNNSLEEIKNIKKLYPGFFDYLLNKEFSLDNYPGYLEFFDWVDNALIAQISGYIFNFSTADGDINEALNLFEGMVEYLEFISNTIRNISFQNKPMINKYNLFIKKTEFRPNAFYQLQNYFLLDESEEKFNNSKKNILDIFKGILTKSFFFLSTIEKLENDDYQFLENKNLLFEWPNNDHQLLYKSYLNYLINDTFKNQADSRLKEKIIQYEKEYKLNYINQVWVLKYLNLIKEFEDNKQLFFNYEFLPSSKLFNELIKTNFGTKDDLLFLNYADLHTKLLVSSNSNFCYNPFIIIEKLNFLKDENKDSQNFLLNAYLDELDFFFSINSSFYLNCLNHFNEEDLKPLFNK